MIADVGLEVYQWDIYRSSLKFLWKNDVLGVKNYCLDEFHYAQAYSDGTTRCQKRVVFFW
jgi:hypothetical protein